MFSSSWFTVIENLLLPRGCAGCDTPDEVLCASCLYLFKQLQTFNVASTSVTGISCGIYQGKVRHAILSWKDHHDEELDEIFARLLSDILISQHIIYCTKTPILCIPAPSSAQSVRKRGRNHMENLAQTLCKQLRQQGYNIVCSPILSVQKVHNKSVQTHSIQQRVERLEHGIHVQDALARTFQSSHAVIIDDIVTSGATMNQCVQACIRHGITVHAALSLAYTPPRA